MFPKIQGIIDTAYKAYPPIAMGICTHGLVSEGQQILAHPQDSHRTQRMHTILNLSIAIGSLVAIYFSPVVSDFLNGSYYLSHYQADFYESNQGNYKQIWRGFYLFAATAAFGLSISGAITLPLTALLATRIAGQVLSTIETGLFIAMVAGAVKPTMKYLARPCMPSVILLTAKETKDI